MNLQYNKPYTSGPIAETDLHAGGVFFCIVYESVITFYKDNTLELKTKMIEAFRPMDDEDIKRIENIKPIKTIYSKNRRGYLEFKIGNAEYTGMTLEVNTDILAFNVYNGEDLYSRCFFLKK